MHEEVVSAEGSGHDPQLAARIKDAMRAGCLPQLVEAWQSILQLHESEGSSISSAHAAALCAACLHTMHLYVSWIDIGLVSQRAETKWLAGAAARRRTGPPLASAARRVLAWPALHSRGRKGPFNCSAPQPLSPSALSPSALSPQPCPRTLTQVSIASPSRIASTAESTRAMPASTRAGSTSGSTPAWAAAAPRFPRRGAPRSAPRYHAASGLGAAAFS